MDAVDAIEAEVDSLVRQGHVTPLRGAGRVEVVSSAFRAIGVSRACGSPEYASVLNTDNVLVASTTVANEEALVLAVAHGNYKDRGCAFAAGVAVCEVYAALAKPLLAPADVPPALRRAVLRASTRVLELAATDVSQRRVGTVMGMRKNLRGIGASLLAMVVTRREIVIAHVGENRAFLLRDGSRRELVVPHTLWFAYDTEARAAMDTEQAAFAQDVVMRVVGLSDKVAFDVTRLPRVADGDRIVLASGAHATSFDDGDPIAWDADIDVLADSLARRGDASWAPATVVVADVAPRPR